MNEGVPASLPKQSGRYRATRGLLVATPVISQESLSSLLNLEHWMLASRSLPVSHLPFHFQGIRHLISLHSLHWLLHLWALFRDWCRSAFFLVQLGLVSWSVLQFHLCSCHMHHPSNSRLIFLTACWKFPTNWLLGISNLVCAQPN